ncbi:MAG: aspartate 1-decarboxylase [Candidatus Aureabacteria bacterium]|nr:aspartate 1-decarboxylase [Candidatus Auribacterota bacterium]
MLIEVLKSKIHQAKITQCSINYNGSLGLDEAFTELAGLNEYEKILIANLSNGKRLETYIIIEERNSGIVSLNGAAARLGEIGDKIIILSFGLMNEEEIKSFKPKIVFMDDQNVPSVKA